jgi:hypothetical protein
MKTQFETLEAFASRVQELDARKQDYVLPARALKMEEDGYLSFADKGFPQRSIPLNAYAEGQLAEKLKIPKAYYDACRAIPGLQSRNVSAWLEARDGSVMLRTYEDEKVRAVLSDRFRTFDNMFVLTSLLPTLAGIKGDVQVHASALTDRRMYIEISSRSVEAEVLPGDVVRSGIVISNSEVGAGRVDVSRLIWRKICGNGLIVSSVLQRQHVGRKIDTDDTATYRDDTIVAELRAFQLRLRDVMASAFEQSFLDEQVERMRGAVKDAISKPVATIENVTRRFALPAESQELILADMMREGQVNRYSLMNGITALAKLVDNADLAYEYERIGNDVLTLTPSQWEEVTA